MPKLFAAGILPGVLLTLLFIAVIAVMAFARPAWMPRSAKRSIAERQRLLAPIWGC